MLFDAASARTTRSGAIRVRVVNDEDVVVDLGAFEGRDEVVDRSADRSCFVVGRDQDRQDWRRAGRHVTIPAEHRGAIVDAGSASSRSRQ
jgi:hypothetical protein